MKILTFMIYFLFLAYAKCAFLSSTERNRWEEFKLKYNKTYSSAIEENQHQKVFLKNLKEFEQHNGKYKAGLVSYTKGINQFADVTIEDFSKRLYRFNINKTHRTPVEKFSLPSGFQVPNEMDWRKKGAVTSVKNQITCGACWSFSATGALESQLFIKKNILVTLSEQNLIDCSKHLGNLGCEGGVPSLAFEYIRQNNGIDTEESYPYENREGKCRFNPHTVGGTCKGFVSVYPDEDALKYAVATVGPVSVGINSDPLQHYEGGILNGPNCDPENINHAALVVGYGNENGSNYWILKNSWGEQFGEAGYVRIARNRNNYCGITTIATYPLV